MTIQPRTAPAAKAKIASKPAPVTTKAKTANAPPAVPPPPSVATAAAAPLPAPPVTTGKLATLVALLRREQGATLAEMTAATGWQAHSIRGAISGSLKKKLKLTITSIKADGVRTYRIAEPAVD